MVAVVFVIVPVTAVAVLVGVVFVVVVQGLLLVAALAAARLLWPRRGSCSRSWAKHQDWLRIRLGFAPHPGETASHPCGWVWQEVGWNHPRAGRRKEGVSCDGLKKRTLQRKRTHTSKK